MHPNPIPAEQPRTIKARYLAAGLSVVYGDGTRDLVADVVRDGDDVTVTMADGAAASYDVEEGVTVLRTTKDELTIPAGAVDVLAARIADVNAEVAEVELDPRRAAYELVLAGVAAGLPIPDETWIPSNNTVFTVHLADNDPASVDSWAAFLGLETPAYGSTMRGPRRPFRSYEAKGRNCPGMPGWLVDVQSFCDVAELEAQQAGGVQ